MNFYALRVMSPSALITKLSVVPFGYSEHEKDGVCCTPACQQILGVHFSPCLAALLVGNKADSSRASCLCPLPCSLHRPVTYFFSGLLSAGTCWLQIGKRSGKQEQWSHKGNFLMCWCWGAAQLHVPLPSLYGNTSELQ